MISFNGVCLQADGWRELHEFARLMGVTRSWFSLEPIPHYEVICPFKAGAILAYLKKREKTKANGKIHGHKGSGRLDPGRNMDKGKRREMALSS